MASMLPKVTVGKELLSRPGTLTHHTCSFAVSGSRTICSHKRADCMCSCLGLFPRQHVAAGQRLQLTRAHPLRISRPELGALVCAAVEDERRLLDGRQLGLKACTPCVRVDR